jgi:CRISPR/Cas system-associated exonuclease Cas4 (RecB family)
MARLCPLAPELAEKYPESSAAAMSGRLIHAEIAAAITAGKLTGTESKEAAAAFDWAMSIVGDKIVETEVRPGWTQHGTPDMAVHNGNNIILVDWKTGNEVEHPDTNLQLLVYGVAVAQKAGADTFTPVIVYLRGGEARPVSGVPVHASEWHKIIAEVQALNAERPEARPGVHCGGCYEKHYCASWQARTQVAMLAVGGPGEAALTSDTAQLLLQRLDMAKKWSEAAREVLEAFVEEHGPVVADGKQWSWSMSNGRRSGPSADECEKLGRPELIKEGKPFKTWKWTPVKT